METDPGVPKLRRVYWETTAQCNLNCIHCRRTDVLNRADPKELTTEQSKSFIDDLTNFGKPVLILSGGEPLFRKDIFDIASYAKNKGLPVALSTNGTLLTEKITQKVRDSGIYYASISLDGAEPKTHDTFRGEGNFKKALRGFNYLKKFGIKVQVNFTVTRQNVRELKEMVDLTRRIGADALYLFLLVPVGCGMEIADSQMLSSQEVENWLRWVSLIDRRKGPDIRVICAPHYYRVQEQLKSEQETPHLSSPNTRLGCLAGINICFVSHKGNIYPCGYLPISAGNVKLKPLSEIWRESRLLGRLRDENLLEGKCGVCEFKTLCGGCRARAYYQYGNELAEESNCLYDSCTNEG